MAEAESGKIKVQVALSRQFVVPLLPIPVDGSAALSVDTQTLGSLGAEKHHRSWALVQVGRGIAIACDRARDRVATKQDLISRPLKCCCRVGGSKLDELQTASGPVLPAPAKTVPVSSGELVVGKRAGTATGLRHG